VIGGRRLAALAGAAFLGVAALALPRPAGAADPFLIYAFAELTGSNAFVGAEEAKALTVAENAIKYPNGASFEVLFAFASPSAAHAAFSVSVTHLHRCIDSSSKPNGGTPSWLLGTLRGVGDEAETVLSNAPTHSSVVIARLGEVEMYLVLGGSLQISTEDVARIAVGRILGNTDETVVGQIVNIQTPA